MRNIINKKKEERSYDLLADRRIMMPSFPFAILDAEEDVTGEGFESP